MSDPVFSELIYAVEALHNSIVKCKYSLAAGEETKYDDSVYDVLISTDLLSLAMWVQIVIDRLCKDYGISILEYSRNRAKKLNDGTWLK